MIVRDLLIRLGLTGGNQTEQAMARVDTRVNTLNNSVDRLVKQFAAGFTIHWAIEVLDSMQSMEARIAQLPQTIGDVGAAFDEVARHANATRQSIVTYGTLYLRVGNAAKKYLKDQESVLEITDTLSNALLVGGANAEEQSSALLQFSQALGSGVLQGDEFRAMAEAAPQFLDKLSEALNIPRENLKKMASQGQLTTKQVIEGTKKMSDYFAKRAKEMPMTIGQSFTIIGNHVSVMMDHFNRETSAASQIGHTLINVFDKLERLALGYAWAVDNAVRATMGWKNLLIGIASSMSLLAVYLFPIEALFVALAGAVGLVAEDLQTYFAGGDSITGDVVKAWNDMVAGISVKADEIWHWMTKPFDDAWNSLQGWAARVKAWWQHLWDSLPGIDIKIPDWMKKGGQAIGLSFDVLGAGFDEGARLVRSAIDGGPVQSSIAQSAGLAAPSPGTGIASVVPRGPWSDLGRLNTSGPITIQNNGDTHITVPEGTSSEQAAEISRQAQEAFDTNWSRALREVLGDHPNFAGAN